MNASAEPILNVSGYRFVELNDAALLRESMRSRALELGLRGTIILAAEGVNLALAGTPMALRGFIAELDALPRFAGIDWKFSTSAALPFGKLVVRVKREIVRMNQPLVRPQQGRAPSISAQTLARWLRQGQDDHGREVVMLDTRNGFEVDHGRFRGALDWRLSRFSEFPQALAQRRGELEGKTVVSYCTGGIRCEKAALWMQHEGVASVLQLDGGILKFLELGDADHFDGSCFVFDAREALDSRLAPTANAV